jgi:methionine-rich copper-binding protein CopC
MKAFALAIVAIVAIAAGAHQALENLPLSSAQVESSPAVRLGE